MKLAASIALLASLSLGSIQAIAAEPVEDRDYFRVSPAAPTSDPSKIVVTEFFSYQCPHCFTFAKPFAAWSASLPADVKAERAAVAIGHAEWAAAANAFCALSAMKAVPQIDDALFDAIHRGGKKLTDEASFASWLAGQGIDRAKFEQTYRSFSVQLQVKRADELSRKVRLPSVPTLVIDGRYMIRIADDGDFRDQLAHANSLIERVRRERSGGKPSPQ
jgi:thiol:disulfide interchange protein DsbA